MRKLTITFALLLGLFVGYIAGCQARARARLMPPDPEPGQVWVDREGHRRIVRAVTREADKHYVWWHHPVSTHDRRCLVRTWRAWARKSYAKVSD